MKLSETGQPDNDKVLAKIEKKINKEYTIANKEMEKKLKNYMKKFEAKDKEKKKLVKKGLLDEDEYLKWRQGKIVVGKQWESMCQVLAEDLDNSRKIAQHIVSNDLPTVYANGVNYGTWEIESNGINTNFTLYNHDAVEILVSENPKLYPDPTVGSETWQKLKSKEVQKWSKAKINSSITQAILQGEAIDQIAKRLRKVTDMDYKASVRNARTMVGAAQNAGHQRSYERAEKMGVNLVKVWVSTLDMRTRHTHAVMDGEAVPVKEKFSNGLLYPRDILNGTPAEVYNCRCRPISQVKGFEKTPGSLIEGKQDKLNGMTYDEWKQYHQDVLDRKFKKPAKASGKKYPRTQKYLDNLPEETKKYERNQLALEGIDKDLDILLDAYEDDFGFKTKDDVLKSLNSGIKKVIDESDMVINIRADDMIKVLDDGTFKNQFESGHSGGLFSPSERKWLERDKFNVPREEVIANADRPIYGALHPKFDPDDAEIVRYYTRGPSSHYGNGVHVVMKKDNVIENATMTIGDSLDNKADVIGTLMSDPVYSGRDWSYSPAKVILYDNGKRDIKDIYNGYGGYWEFQLHGAQTHTIDCIEKVYLEADGSMVGVANALKEKSIPYEFIGNEEEVAWAKYRAGDITEKQYKKTIEKERATDEFGKKEDVKFSVGDRVAHAKFGVGVIIKVYAGGAMVDVDFGRFVKTIATGFIKKI